MSVDIISSKNTKVFRKFVNCGEVFICVQGKNESCAILEVVDGITVGVLEQMREMVEPEIVKIISTNKDYNILKSALSLVFENLKFVNRENGYELFFEPSTSLIRASLKSVEENKPEKLKSNIEQIKKQIKVLIVDDSKTICNLLGKIMGLSPNIVVVGSVNDPLDAEAAIKKLKPDVITLDIHMPNMNGVELLKKIQPKFKIPAIMISSISMQEGPLVLDALESGAVDYIQKPDMSNFAAVANEINTKILSASKTIHHEKEVSYKGKATSDNINLDNNLIVIGASTGGTKALKDLLDALPENIPPILIVQHIPAEFSKAFADRLNNSVKFTVKQASDGDEVLPNQVLIAPGGKQMKFMYKGGRMKVEINEDAPVNRFQPSVDYLFDSVSNSSIDKHIVAAIFTGMGRDGSAAMKRLKAAKNCTTIAQDEKSCVVFGMPKEAIKLGCVDHIAPLCDAAAMLMESCVIEEQEKAQ